MSVYDLAAIIVVLLACYGASSLAWDVLWWVLGKLSRRRKP